MALRFDEISDWSEMKLDIIKQYALQYSRILANQPKLYHVYIDAFAGAGVHISRATRDLIPGSPLNALLVQPSFKHHYLIDLDGDRVANLNHLVGTNQTVSIYQGDCNHILLSQVFPRVRYEDFRRGLCLLDPYGLHLDWKVIEQAGKMRSIDMFLNFPIMDMNRNVFWSNPEHVDDADIMRMNRFWGDASWRTAAYRTKTTFIGQVDQKVSNEAVAQAFKERLQQVAGFAYVAEPMPMKNSQNATVYYLFFASQNATGLKIVKYLFDKYRGPSQASMSLF